jgi:hypothetical protein
MHHVEGYTMTQLMILLIGVSIALGFFAISVGVCLLDTRPKPSQTNKQEQPFVAETAGQ